MDANRFDRFICTLSAASSRRGVAQGLAGLALFGVLGPLLGPADTEGKGKRKKRRRRRKPTCSDGKKNGNETGIDCGGSCPRCADGQGCLSRDDCASGVCATGTSGTCVRCDTFASRCGNDAGGDCYCNPPETGGLPVCGKGFGTLPDGSSCDTCPAGTFCIEIGGYFSCHKHCGEA